METLISATAAIFLGGHFSLAAAPVELTEQPPESITKPVPGVILVDFGKVAFGNLKFTPPEGTSPHT